ncbi:MAG: methyltransferase family protein, partial [Solirubrobacteraceae bacterium]
MHTLRTVIAAVWIVFWVYWLAAALTAKRSAPRGRRRWLRLNGVGVIGVVLLLRIFRGGNATIHSPVLGAIGAVLIAAGLGVAIWARIVIGRNWGMPMTQKQEPELVTGGPYATVRHPIYSGLLFAIAGTALATSLWALVIA